MWWGPSSCSFNIVVMSCVFTKCLHNLWALSAVQVQHSHHLRALHAQRVQHSTSFGHPVFKKCNTPSVLAENGPSPIRLRRLYFRISGSWGGPSSIQLRWLFLICLDIWLQAGTSSIRLGSLFLIFWAIWLRWVFYKGAIGHRARLTARAVADTLMFSHAYGKIRKTICISGHRCLRHS